MAAILRLLNLLFIYILVLVLLGGILYQLIKGEAACYLCILQRLGMIGIISALLMNFRFGVKVQHYGLAILSALMGRIFSLRQIAMHVCPEFPAYGEAIFGFDLYIWAFIIFTCSIFACAVLTIFFGYSRGKEFPPSWGLGARTAFWATALIVAINLITTLKECGLGVCLG